MPSEPIRDNAVDRGQGDRDRPQCAAAIGLDRLDDIADKSTVLRPAWREARRLVTAPHDAVGGVFDLSDLVAVLYELVAGKIEHSRTARAERRAIENNTALPSPPPTKSTVSPDGVSVGVPVGPIGITGSPGFSRAQRSEDPPISSTTVDTSPASCRCADSGQGEVPSPR
jgi:hypothetical protein